MEKSLPFTNGIERMKKELFAPSANLFALLPVSAYETAWVAMVPDPDDPTRPMFPEYLDWVRRSQNALGFWFEEHMLEQPKLTYEQQWSSEDLMATLACLLSLKTWEAAGLSEKINKGIKFLEDNMEEELRIRKEGGDEAGLRRLFLMVGLAKAKGLKFNKGLFDELKLNGEKLKREDDGMAYTVIMREIASENGDSEHFRSPSATACAFVISGDEAYKTYLQHLVIKCRRGAPPIYISDGSVIQLCVVDHLERLGCAEHFTEEISDAMNHQYRKWIAEESKVSRKDEAAFQIYKDSLAFRLLRMHGYQVSPRRFCWFIDDEKIKSKMKDNCAFFLGPMLSIYRASHIAFPKDYELDKVGVFAHQILQMGILNMESQNKSNISELLMKFKQEIEHELGFQWLARMDYLEHRFYLERGGIYQFWTGRNVPCRIFQNNDLLQLAIDNLMTRQLVYRKELNELHRWSRDTGLSMVGFGREKTAYCYFAMASSIYLPLDIDSRKEAVKCAILITVADDFFDEEGSLHELSNLTDAVERWEGESLTSHSKVIFAALNNLVHDICLKTFKRHGYDVKKILQDVWKDIFKSWLREAQWSKSTHHPSIHQYIEIAMTSIAVQIIILTGCYLTNSKIIAEDFCWDFSNTMLTKSLMISCRLLNDLKSYEKEATAGKSNVVLLYLKENPEAKIDDAIAFVRNNLEKKKRELLQMVMSTDSAGPGIPRQWKLMHLSCLKVFYMFFNSINAFDSPTVLLDSINKTIYEPLMKEMTNQPAEIISKELKTTKTKASYTKVKDSRASKKSTVLSIDSNKRLGRWTDRRFHKQSFACSFMACNTTTYKNVLWK